MAIDVVAEIVAIRERVARMETTLDQIKMTLNATKHSVEKSPPNGSIVVPVALITALIQGGIAALQHFS